jgi:hypothetical protein
LSDLFFKFRDISKIQKYWLPDKNESEIKHRFKNCTCSKADPNIIKDWKACCKEPFIPEEKEKLKQGVDWFGDTNRWSLITK